MDNNVLALQWLWVYFVSKFAVYVWILPTMGSVSHNFPQQKKEEKILPLFLFPIFTLTLFSEHIGLENLSGISALVHAAKL